MRLFVFVPDKIFPRDSAVLIVPVWQNLKLSPNQFNFFTQICSPGKKIEI